MSTKAKCKHQRKQNVSINENGRKCQRKQITSANKNGNKSQRKRELLHTYKIFKKSQPKQQSFLSRQYCRSDYKSLSKRVLVTRYEERTYIS